MLNKIFTYFPWNIYACVCLKPKTSNLKPLIMLFALSAVVHARIGETTEALHTRYGAGKDVGDQLLFSEGNYDLSVYFDKKGKSVMEIYSKMKRDTSLAPEFSQEEIDALLKEHGDGQIWREAKTSKPGKLVWVRYDRGVFASYYPDKNVLVFKGTESF